MICALVPAKALDEAKTRLAALLSEGERRRLALVMLEDVVHALQAVPRIGSIAVISPDDDVLETARILGAEAIEEPPNRGGINQALDHALNEASHPEFDTLLVVLADVPAIAPAEIESILDALPADRGAVICPSSAGGTSALALRPPDAIPFRFGSESFAAHQGEASRRGVPLAVLTIDSLTYDIDEPDDLRHLLTHPTDTNTHHLLSDLRIFGRLSSRT